MDRPPAAPPVVVVIVASDPGPGFEEALACFGRQDYPNLSVLVVDGSPTTDPAPRVASVLPDAYVRRIEGITGFAALANDVLETVQGAAFLLFTHSDVAPDPDAIRRMVEEALRSNAAVVAPKVVEWDRPERLLEVGMVVDKTGAIAPVAERGELDQEQHDAVRDVFAVSATCMLVRSDLFFALGGFDPVLGDHGADLDFCWRAMVAGGRVLVAPAARVRHALPATELPGADPRFALFERRHHIRAMLKNYSFLHLLRVVPQALAITLVEVVVALAGRRWREARLLLSAWWWNVRHLGELLKLRRAIQRVRAVPDSDVRRLQVRGSVRLTTYVQRRLHAEDRAEALVEAGHRFAGALGKGPGQAAAILLGVIAVALLVGSRHLLADRLPAVGEFSPFPRPFSLLSSFVGGWRTTGVGSSAPAPTAFALLGVSGLVFLGKMALLQKVLVLGVWPLAAVGIWRLTGPFQSALARLVAVVAYVAVPLPYDSLAGGRWSALLAWGVMPWALVILTRLSGLAPFDGGRPEGEPLPAVRGRAEVLKLALLVAVVGAVAPPVAVAVVAAAVGILAGSLLAGGTASAARIVRGAVIAVAVALILHVPWSIDLLVSPGGWATLTGVAPDPSTAPSFGSLLRFEVGPRGGGPLGWAFLIAAALALVVGRGWRLGWAIRCWGMALVCTLLAWAGTRGWVPLRLESPDVLLAPAALGLALAAGLGAAAFDLDLPGYRFGWRQLASLAAGAALVAGVLPVLGGVPDGRWGLTDREVARSLAWMAPEVRNGSFRVLWLGDPRALPLDGWRLDEGIAYGTSRDGVPEATELLPGSTSSATRAMARSLRLAERGDTARLGRLLAPMAVRYIVVPSELATGREEAARFPVPASLSRALVSQIDLRQLPSDPAVSVYENISWGPARAVLPDRLGTGPVPTSLGAGADLSGGTPVLPGEGPVRFSGTVPPGTVLVSEASSSRWSLAVDGEGAARRNAYGVANAYASSGPGRAVLRYRTPLLRYGFLVLQLVLWVIAIRALVGLRRRGAGATVQLEAPAHP
ncbi:MAG: glycosyltransferase family 2 protein [Actinomycetota bacterium]|nr:glycosyltransferase family 2 protein [Actinomycetota bacterium]